MTALPYCRAVLIAAAVSLLAAAPAHAFTMENSDSTNATRQGYVDLDTSSVTKPTDKPSAKLDENGNTRSGPFFMNFGSTNSYQQNYNPSHLFNPDYAPGR